MPATPELIIMSIMWTLTIYALATIVALGLQQGRGKQ
jgi:hypothetical protein